MFPANVALPVWVRAPVWVVFPVTASALFTVVIPVPAPKFSAVADPPMFSVVATELNTFAVVCVVDTVPPSTASDPPVVVNPVPANVVVGFVVALPNVSNPAAVVSITTLPCAVTLNGFAVDDARVPTVAIYPVPVDAAVSFKSSPFVAPVSCQFQIWLLFALDKVLADVAFVTADSAAEPVATVFHDKFPEPSVDST